MKRYNPSEIEPKWQQAWQEAGVNKASIVKDKQKMYVSGMFPYPSGAGMHTGHAFSYSIVDAIARFYRQHGYEVLNPMGWDTFGLPAENYAIKNGEAPAKVTAENIANFKKQFKRMGVSIDWDREINTSDPDYYKWTQWIFTQLFEKGLAYQKESLQWWCPVDKTVLANEQVEAGRCWRCNNQVEKKSMKQWFFKITDYSDDLLDEIEDLDWPTKIKTAQTNWIGKSTGAEIEFEIKDFDKKITVFTTRPDTLFGATALMLAPEHKLAKNLLKGDFKDFADNYIKVSLVKSDIDRMNESREKTGVFTGSVAINPANGKEIPIWIADYVLGGYGTGAIMSVPAHDSRDYEFATKFGLDIVEVVEKPDDSAEEIYSGEGKLVNSGNFDGKQSDAVRELIVAWLEEQKIGRGKVQYKMHDWLISRQRYWGAPIPVVHCEEHGAVSVEEKDLPVLLPEVKDYAPKGDGKSVLASVEDWVNTTCPKCNSPAKRETDTMDGYACSSWYLLRYADPNNSEMAWDPEAVNYWAPVDYYVGGDHAVAHLLYVRFWTHVFKQMGLTNFKEPIKKLVYHGYINAEDGTKMSKSKGNVIDPLDVIDQGYGADALRCYVLFMGPVELDATWDSRGIAGVYRFLNRLWVLAQEYTDASEKTNNSNDKQIDILVNKTIKKVTDDYRRLSFNTALSALMELVNELYKLKLDGFSDKSWNQALSSIVQLLAPMAPHMSEELWHDLGQKSFIQDAKWPSWDDSLLSDDTVVIVVQVNGRLRAKLNANPDVSQDAITKLALSDSHVKEFVGDKKPAKVIYVPGRLLNIVTK